MNNQKKPAPQWAKIVLFGLFLGTLIIMVSDRLRSRTSPHVTPQAPTKDQIQARIESAAAFLKTPAGKLCAKHPTWSNQDCTWLLEKRYWIGMGYDMLEYSRGKPNSIRPSNYGKGVQYQYCWFNYSPSCFYDNDGDNLVDAYN